MRVRSLSVPVREFAMFLSGRSMVLGLFVLAALVVVLRLVVVMGRSVVVASGGMVMLARRMFCHFLSAFPNSGIAEDRISVSPKPMQLEDC